VPSLPAGSAATAPTPLAAPGLSARPPHAKVGPTFDPRRRPPNRPEPTLAVTCAPSLPTVCAPPPQPRSNRTHLLHPGPGVSVVTELASRGAPVAHKRASRKATPPRPPTILRTGPAPATSIVEEPLEARRADVRPTSISCDWCARATTVKPRGRVPRWCSETCRHRAWEQARAAASGRSANQIVERVVQAAPPAAPAERAPASVSTAGEN